MFYENFNNDKKIKYSKNILKEFKCLNTDIYAKILSLNSRPMTYNFDFSNGVLKDGMGLESLNFRYLSPKVTNFKKCNKSVITTINKHILSPLIVKYLHNTL